MHNTLDMTKLARILVAAALMAPPGGWAQQVDRVDAEEPAPRQTRTPPPAPGGTDSLFVRDRQEGVLDTVCRYGTGGPLLIEVWINRYVGEVNSNGFLRDPDTLIRNGVISEYAFLQLPARDVDSELL